MAVTSIDCPVKHRAVPTGSERRRETRHTLKRIVEILPCDESNSDAFMQTELYDCSIHGVALLLNKPLRVGSEFLLKIQLDETQIVLYTVRNARLHEPNGKTYRVGAEFSGYIAASADTKRETIVDALTRLDESGAAETEAG